jgi:hypothetical protein
MASYRGYTKGINDAALKKFIDNYTARMVSIAKQAGLAAMKELREAAVDKWYNGKNSKSMKRSTKYEIASVKQSNHKIDIVVRSYVDPSKFRDDREDSSHSKVVKWRERHEVDGWRYCGVGEPREAIDMPYSVGEYLFRLPWEEGIIGLPPHERYTGTGWVNPNGDTTQETTLQHDVEKHLSKHWDETVKTKFDEMK